MRHASYFSSYPAVDVKRARDLVGVHESGQCHGQTVLELCVGTAQSRILLILPHRSQG